MLQMSVAEYGMGSKASTCGDVYSYGILLLEMFTGKMPTDDMFQDGLNLHNYVKMALPEFFMVEKKKKKRMIPLHQTIVVWNKKRMRRLPQKMVVWNK